MADHGTVEYATATGNDYAGARAGLRELCPFHACRHPLCGDRFVWSCDRRRDGTLVPGRGYLRDRIARRYSGPAQQGNDAQLRVLCDLFSDLRLHRTVAALTKFPPLRIMVINSRECHGAAF